jgi:phosphoheptose isomerase
MNKVNLIDLYKKESSDVFNSIPSTEIAKFVDMVFDVYENEGTIFAAGNGGNVASVQNLVVDLNMHPFVSEDKGSQTIPRNKFKCVSLCSDQATITGVSNDLGYEHIFSEQLKYQGDENDMFFGLQGHPDKLRLSEMDATTGSLGQGLSIAIGHALGKQLRGEDGKVFCLLGDGEMQEGQVWESLMYVPKTDLKNLVCLIDWNKGQNDGWSEDFSSMYDNLRERISSFGWDCETIDGHDVNVISTKLAVESEKPRCIILNTMKGKGVSFMEDPSWHAKVPTEEQYEQAIKELGV